MKGSRSVVTLICPRCGQSLTVSERAPRELSCPNCLARVVNPGGREALAPPRDSSRPPPLPVRVIPLDYQVERDKRGVDVLLAIQALLFGAGAVASYLVPQMRELAFLLALACIALVVTTVVLARRSTTDVSARTIATVAKSLAGGCMLMGLLLAGIVLLVLGACALLLKNV